MMKKFQELELPKITKLYKHYALELHMRESYESTAENVQQ
jgi:hypothetical protein